MKLPVHGPPAVLPAVAALLVLGITSTSIAACPPENAVFGAPIHFPIGKNVHWMVTGDFNSDGTQDVAVTNGDVFNGGTGSRVHILLGQGGHSYGPPVPYPAGLNTHGLVVGDFNEDGILDLAAANKWSHDVSVLLGNGSSGHGDGTFAAPVSYPVSSSPFDLVTADFDGDGILDLATCKNASSGVAILKGLGAGGVGNGTFAAAVVLPTWSASTGLEVGDFNGDGAPDLVETEYSTGTVAVLMNSGNGSFAPAAHFAAGPQPFGAVVADFNEDGKADIAVANTNAGGTAILLGNGAGQFAAPTMLPTGNIGSLMAADFNQDGILDLVAGVLHGDGTGYIALHRGRGVAGVGDGTFGPVEPIAVGHDAYQLFSGDFDGDGYVDLFVSDNDAAGNPIVDPLTLLPGACQAPPPDPRYPVLTDVRDVPNDQGGKVFLTWTASSLDAPGGAVNQYRVWRRIPPGSSSTSIAAGKGALLTSTRIVRPDGSTEVVYWEALVTLPAQRLAGYGYTAATTQDSMANSNPWTAFFVSALTSNIDVFYSSNVDSGYSVDNLPPHRPRGIGGELVQGGVQLRWDENTDGDVQGYLVYRGATGDFEPSATNRIANVSRPEFLDGSGTGGETYKISAIDRHGNEGPVATLDPIVVLDVPGVGPTRFALESVRPNPSRDGRWTVEFSLPSTAPARIEVLDLGGRRVAMRDVQPGTAGRQALAFENGRSLRPGIYHVRLIQGSRRAETRLVVVR